MAAKKVFSRFPIQILIISVICFILGGVIGLCLGYSVGYEKSMRDNTAYFSSNRVINLSQGPADNPFFKAQLEIPPSYFAVDDNMLGRYDSQGGMAPPRLILTKKYQVLGDDFASLFSTYYNNETCIAVWTTMGFSDISDWVGLIGFNDNNSNPQNIKLSDKENLNVGSRKAEIYKLLNGKRYIYVGFINLNDKQSTSYFFNTCDLNNKQDLLTVIKSIKLAGDLKLQ